LADLEKYLIYGLAFWLQVLARCADFVTVWLLSSYQCKQLPQTWKYERDGL
jgi:hypothetical protein